MIQKIDKYGNTSTDDGRVIVLDKYANIKKVNKAIWGSITGTLTDQTDLTTYLSTNYYPLTSNPAGYLTSVDVTLQNAYTNSTDGQIILDATRGPVKIKGSVPNSVLFELLDLANVETISFLSNGDVKIRDNASIYYDAFNSIKFDTLNGISLKSFDYTKADGRIQYATDYTSLYTSRTLIDKGYADAHYLGASSSLSTASGDATGTVAGTNLPLTLATVNSSIGTFNNVTVNAKGLITSASNISYLTTISGITAGGDLQGTYPNPVVHQIQGKSVQTGSPADKDLLIWDNTASMWKHQQIITITGYNNTNWDSAYTNRITNLTTTGTGAATLISNVLNIPTPPTATFTSLTATGSSGSSTLTSGVLNVPTYTLSGLGGQPLATNLTSLSGLSYASTSFVKMTASGTFTLDTTTYYPSSNPSGFTNNTGTVTSIAALTLGTTGTDLSSTVANGTTTPVITLNVPTASATNRGALSSTDWSTFNNKQDKSMSAYSLRVNNTNATANATETNFRAQALQSLSGITWTGVTAPTGGSQSYQWQQVGNQVVATFTAIYTIAGAALTQVNIALPSDMPTPIRPTGVTATAGAKCYIGIASLSGSTITLGTTNTCFMVVNATDTTKFDIVVSSSSSATRVFYITITYFTA